MDEIDNLLLSYVLYMFQTLSFRGVSISNVNVDNEGIISTQIPVAYSGEYLKYLFVSTSSYDNIYTMDNS